jgi:molecular chaperone DnaK (HSP70)
MPSVVRFNTDEEEPLVGFPVLLTLSETDNDKSKSSILRSVKRLLGKRFEDLDPAWIETLDFDVRHPSEYDDDQEGSLQLVVRTNSTSKNIAMTPQQVLAIELKAIRKACQAYLDRYRLSKNLRVPGGEDEVGDTDDRMNQQRKLKDEKSYPLVDNVVVGVPAHYSLRHIGLVKKACREAGFHGYVGTCLESTAAAIAYGLTLQERSKRTSEASTQQKNTIMVVDMGGGTTDITIASRRTNLHSPRSDSDDENDPSSSYRVLVTQGDDKLGGDDIDQAMVEYCSSQVSQQPLEDQNNREMIKTKSDSLMLACRKAKESLCRLEDPSPSETIIVDCYCDDGSSNATTKTKRREILITQEILNTTILEPWLRRARDLILKARKDLNKCTTTTGLAIDEVILVGGTTRVPAIRRMIQGIFLEIELSSSLNPMSSVAQGLAIQAAIMSKQIPMHELKSAMMLDCVPHAIGVQLSSADGTQQNGGFVEIIPRNTLLPATGSATFLLANKHQAGVTIRAVEEVGPDTYEPMSKENFSFVLRKLPKSQSENISERTIQVGMKLDTDGRFIVSIFDENDPEQVRKKDRFERIKNGEVVGELEYIKDMMLAESNDITKEQVTLTIALISLFVLYVAIKIAFTDPLDNDSSILG